jgi:hypothetical protein
LRRARDASGGSQQKILQGVAKAGEQVVVLSIGPDFRISL